VILPAATLPIVLFFAVENLHAYAATLAGLAIVVVRLRRTAVEERRETGLRVILWGSLAATVPYVLVSAFEAAAPGQTLPGGLGSEDYVLLFTLIPLSLLYALLRRGPAATPNAG
jgi:hypothetical protein